MNEIEPLTELNYLLYCAKHYNNPSCFSDEEFLDDLNRVKYIKRLFNKYHENGDLKERLILNHIIILYNVFGKVAATRILFFRLRKFKEDLKTFLEFLGYMPDKIFGIGLDNVTFSSDEIEINETIKELLRNI